MESLDALPDQVVAFHGWLDKQIQDLNTRVRSDARVIAAAKAQGECLRSLGYAFNDPTELANQFFRVRGVISRAV